MALLVYGDQRRPLFPGDRDEGRRLLAEETGGPRQCRSDSIGLQLPSTQHIGRQLLE